jgi:hypothetical protein
MESYVSRNGVNPQGSLGLHPRAAGMFGWMCIGGSSKVTRTAEDIACPDLPVWFRLGRLRGQRTIAGSRGGSRPRPCRFRKSPLQPRTCAREGCCGSTPVENSFPVSGGASAAAARAPHKSSRQGGPRRRAKRSLMETRDAQLPPSSPQEFRTQQDAAYRQDSWDAEAEQGRWCGMIVGRCRCCCLC